MRTTKVVKYDIVMHQDAAMLDLQAKNHSTDAEISTENAFTENCSTVEDLPNFLSFPEEESPPKNSETKMTDHPKVKVERQGLSGLETTMDLMLPDRQVNKMIVYSQG
jgi:hypothetical protein